MKLGVHVSIKGAIHFAVDRAFKLKCDTFQILTSTIWEPLLTGKFGDRARDISMAWLWARIHYRTFDLGYVHGGFDQVYRALLDAVTERGGKVEFDKPVDAIRQPGEQVEVGSGQDRYEFDHLVVTVPQPVFAKAAGLESQDVLWSNQYLGATCFVLECDCSVIPYYWLNVNDTDFPFLAVVEHTNRTRRWKG